MCGVHVNFLVLEMGYTWQSCSEAPMEPYAHSIENAAPLGVLRTPCRANRGGVRRKCCLQDEVAGRGLLQAAQKPGCGWCAAGLRIQRMPGEPGQEFGDPSTYPYLTVASPSCHDTSTTRAWYEEDADRRHRFFYQVCGLRWHPTFCRSKKTVPKLVLYCPGNLAGGRREQQN